MEFETPSNKPIRLIRKDSFYYKHLSLQIRRMNRDQYFSSLTYLKKYKKLLPLYALVDLMKSSEVYKEKNLAVIMGGRKDYEQKTYRDNREILDKYELAIMDVYKAKVGEKVCKPIEKDHELIWVKPEEIADKMYFEYHRYVLNEYIKNNKNAKQEL